MITKTALLMVFISVLIIMLVGCIPPLPQPSVACVDFEPPLTVGTQYGAPAGHNSGDVVFTTNGIPVSVYKFNYISAGGTFNVAFIDSAPVLFGRSQSIRMNNINLEFDFSQLSFQVSQVTIEFLALGGFENLSVNGSSVFAGELSAAPTPIYGEALWSLRHLSPGAKEAQ